MTITTTHEGEEIQVDITDSQLKELGYVEKEGYVSKDYHEKEVKRTHDRVKRSAVKEAKAELEGDEAFIAQLARDAAPDFEAQLKDHKAKWEEENLKPLMEERDSFRERSLDAEILRSAEWSKQVRDNPIQWNALRNFIADRVKHDGEHGFVVMGDNGSPVPGSDKKVYADIADLVATDVDTFKPFMADPPKSTSSPNASVGAGSTLSKPYLQMSDDEKNAFIAEHGTEGVRKALAG